MADDRSESQSTSPSDTPWTTRKLLAWITSRLEKSSIDSPRRSAEMLVSGAIGCDRLRLYMEPERISSDAERETLRDWVTRATRHEPIQYLVGEGWLHGRAYEVDSSTLIPRPSTETLVEHASKILESVPGATILEIGIGAGCVTVSILDALDRPGRAESRRKAAAVADALPFKKEDQDQAQEPPSQAKVAVTPAKVVAIEIVPEAVELARRNLTRHGVIDRVDLRVGSLYEPLDEGHVNTFDLIVSNPPYVSDAEWARCDTNVKDFEPETALRGGVDGLDVIRPLVAHSPNYLKSGGWLAIEIQHDQGPAVAALCTDVGLSSIVVHKDHEGHDRIVLAQKSD